MNAITKQITSRVDYIDLMRGIAILTVVMGHFLENKHTCSMPRLYEVIYSFHMPLFFAISGFTEGKFGKPVAKCKDLLNYEWKASCALLLPYFVWLAITSYLHAHTSALWFLLTLWNVKTILGGVSG